MILHPPDRPANRRPVDVDVHRRQEHADDLPLTRRRAWPWQVAGYHDARIGWRQDQVGTSRGMAIGIAEEEYEERGKNQERYRPGTSEPEAGAHRKNQGPEDERPARSINQHQLIIAGLRVYLGS